MKFTCRTIYIYIYYFFNENYSERNPWNELDAFVNGTLLMLVEPQLERNIPIHDANIWLFYLAKKRKAWKRLSPLGWSIYWTDNSSYLFSVSALPHVRVAPDKQIHLSPTYFVKIITIILQYKLLLRGLGAKCRVRAATSTQFYAKWIKMVWRAGGHCIGQSDKMHK